MKAYEHLVDSDHDDDIVALDVGTEEAVEEEQEARPASPQPRSDHETDVEERLEREDDEEQDEDDRSSDSSAPQVGRAPSPPAQRKSGRVRIMSNRGVEALNDQFEADEAAQPAYSVCFSAAPISISKALDHPEWRAAIDKELNGLIDHKSYRVIDRPVGEKVISSHIILAEKDDGTKKARLVARGNEYIYGKATGVRGPPRSR